MCTSVCGAIIEIKNGKLIVDKLNKKFNTQKYQIVGHNNEKDLIEINNSYHHCQDFFDEYLGLKNTINSLKDLFSKKPKLVKYINLNFEWEIENNPYDESELSDDFEEWAKEIQIKYLTAEYFPLEDDEYGIPEIILSLKNDEENITKFYNNFDDNNNIHNLKDLIQFINI